MGGNIGRAMIGVATGGLSEVANAASGNKLYGKKKKDNGSAAAAAAAAERDRITNDPYNMNSSRFRNQRAFLAEQETSTNGKSTLLGG